MKEQILNATGDKLGRLAGEVLGSDVPHWHNPEDIGGGEYKCLYCNKVGFQKDVEDNSQTCTVGLPIDLTWPEAMRWRDWAVGEFGRVKFCRMLDKAMREVTNNCHMELKRACDARPEHYIKAACLCKLGG